MRCASVSLAIGLATWAVTAPARGADDETRVDAELHTAATIGLTDGVGYPGQDDGTKAAVGFATHGALQLRHGAHEWASHLDVDAAIARANEVDALAKARDGVGLDTAWRWRFASWVGLSAFGSVDASLLGSRLEHPAPTTHLVDHPDGSTTRRVGRSLELTDPGLPIRFQQSVGPLLLPVELVPVRVAIVLGPAARETLADGQRAVDDERGTPAIEVTEMSSATRAGGGGAIEIGGAIRAARIRYRLRADVLVPLTHASERGPSDSATSSGDATAGGQAEGSGGTLASTDVDLRASLSFRLVSWASVDYAFDALREPLVVSDFRVRSSLVLSLGPSIEVRSAR